MRIRCLTAVLALLVLVFAGGPFAHAEDKAEPWRDQATVETLFAEACTAVEAICGAEFKQRPKVVLSHPKTIYDSLKEEMAPLARLGYSAGEVMASRRLFAHVAAGKYDPETHTVHIVPENIARIEESEALPDFTREHLRILLAHEAAHALDFERFKLAAHAASVTSRDALQAYGAVIEGHAEWVAARAAHRWKIDDHLEALRTIMVGSDPKEGDERSTEVHVLLGTMRFAYVQGRTFMQAVYEARGRAGLDAVLRNPPTRCAVIERPVLWLDPDAGAGELDLESLLTLLRPVVGSAPWAAQANVLLKAQLAMLRLQVPEEHRVDFLAGFEGARALLGTMEGESARVVIVLMAFDSEPNAKAYLASQLAMQKARDEAVDLGDSASVDDRPGAGTGGGHPGLTRHATFEVDGEAVRLSHARARIGRLCVEMLAPNVPALTIERMDAVVDRAAAWLADPAAAAKLPPLAVLPFESTVRMITVRVVDEAGKPVPESTVRLVSNDGKTRTYGRTKCLQGECRVRVGSGETHHLLAHRPHSPLREPLDLAPSGAVTVADDATEVTLVLPPGRSVEGRLADTEGNPLEGVRIYARPREGPWVDHGMTEDAVRATTDAEGRFELRGVGAGSWQLTARERNDELLPAPKPFVAADSPLAIEVKPLAGVVIRVVDPEGNPIPRMQVGARMTGPDAPRSHTTTSTDDTGRVRLSGLDPDRTYELTVEPMWGGNSPWLRTSQYEWKPADTEVVVQRGRQVRVQVVDAAGKHTVARVAWRHRGSTSVRKTSADGMLHLHGAQPGEIEMVALRADTEDIWDMLELVPWTKVPAEVESITLTIAVPDFTRRVTVRILGPDGKPVPRVRLWIETDIGDGRHSGQGATAKDGQHEFARPEGRFRLRAYAAETAGEKPLPFAALTTKSFAQDVPEVVLRMETGRPVRGVVLDAAGRPLPHVAVKAWRISEGAVRAHAWGTPIDRTTTDAEGRFVLQRMGSDRYEIRVDPPKGMVVGAPAILEPGAETVTVRMTEPLSVRVIDAEGRPVARARIAVHVTTRDEDGDQVESSDVEVTTDAEGRASIRRYAKRMKPRLVVSPPPTGRPLLSHVDKHWDGQTGGDITLEAGARFGGRVRIDGQPGKGADIQGYFAWPGMDEKPYWRYVGRTKDDGTFTTRVLPRMPMRMRAMTGTDDARVLTYRSPGVEVTPTSTDITLRIERGKETTALRAPGVPRGTQGFMILDSRKTDDRVLAFTFEADGATTIQGLLPGTWTLYIPSVEGGAKCVHHVGIKIPVASVEVKLVDTVTLRFRLEVPPGAGEAKGHALDPALEWRTAVRRADGVFEVKHMPPMRSRVGGYADYKPNWVEGEVVAGPGEIPTIKLVPADVGD